MPRQVLRIVAVLLVACSVGGFTLGVLGASKRGRLPGEAAGPGAADASLNGATDARPLNTDEFLTPQPPEPEKAKEEDDEKAAEETPANKAAVAPPPKTPAPKPLEVPPPVAEPAPAAPAAPEDPPF